MQNYIPNSQYCTRFFASYPRSFITPETPGITRSCTSTLPFTFGLKFSDRSFRNASPVLCNDVLPPLSSHASTPYSFGAHVPHPLVALHFKQFRSRLTTNLSFSVLSTLALYSTLCQHRFYLQVHKVVIERPGK